MRDVSSILPLRLEDVTYEAGGRRLLSDVNIAITRGPRTIILGPNGAGKSLLLRVCHGLLAPGSGTVHWTGDPERARMRQTMVFQHPVMLRRSALANITYALALHRVARRERLARATAALAQIGLDAFAKQPAWLLSAGEQQRLALARACALRPEVLFLDEPTANLDPAATRAVEEAIDTIHSAGTKIIMTTHDLGQARRIADEVLFFHNGHLIEHSPASTFFSRPRSPQAQAYIQGDIVT